MVRKSLAKLLRHPLTRRVPSYIEMQDAAPVVGDDKEAIEHLKGQRWDGEEVHGDDGFAVVVQEGFPLFRRLRVPRRLSHPP